MIDLCRSRVLWFEIAPTGLAFFIYLPMSSPVQKAIFEARFHWPHGRGEQWWAAEAVAYRARLHGRQLEEFDEAMLRAVSRYTPFLAQPPVEEHFFTDLP